MKRYDSAVSPVVGVMLMLVITIVIAAVVSAFAGSLASANADKAPTLAMDVRVVNTGQYLGSGFFATVTGASEQIPTSDLKLITQWTNSSGGRGGATSIGNAYNFDAYVGMAGGGATAGVWTTAVAPFGFGAGVTGTGNPTNPYRANSQHFGNYTLIPGTSLSALPAPYINGLIVAGMLPADAALPDGGYGITAAAADLYTYTFAGDYTPGNLNQDAAQAVLGQNWESLRAGDIVSVDVIHTPTGKTIFHALVPVEGRS